MRRRVPALTILLFVVSAAACSSAPLRREHPKPNPLIKGVVTPEKVDEALRMKVVRRLEYLNANKGTFQAEVIRTRINGESYFFRFYDTFPEDWTKLHILVTELEDDDPVVESYEGVVEYPRVRYETLYATSPDRISTTDSFVRDEGLQRERYRFTGSVWEMRDAYFNVARTSVYRDDAWVPVQRRIRRVEEKQPEYFVDKLRNLFGLLP